MRNKNRLKINCATEENTASDVDFEPCDHYDFLKIYL